MFEDREVSFNYLFKVMVSALLFIEKVILYISVTIKEKL